MGAGAGFGDGSFGKLFNTSLLFVIVFLRVCLLFLFFLLMFFWCLSLVFIFICYCFFVSVSCFYFCFVIVLIRVCFLFFPCVFLVFYFCIVFFCLCFLYLFHYYYIISCLCFTASSLMFNLGPYRERGLFGVFYPIFFPLSPL